MGFTPLARLAQVALDEPVADAVRLLLAAGADGRPAVEAALHQENLPALELLIAGGTDVSQLLAAKLEFTLARGMAADEAALLLRAGAGIGGLPPRLQWFAVELALRDRDERWALLCTAGGVGQGRAAPQHAWAAATQPAVHHSVCEPALHALDPVAAGYMAPSSNRAEVGTHTCSAHRPAAPLSDRSVQWHQRPATAHPPPTRAPFSLYLSFSHLIKSIICCRDSLNE